jgi:hypothetical protein
VVVSPFRKPQPLVTGLALFPSAGSTALSFRTVPVIPIAFKIPFSAEGVGMPLPISRKQFLDITLANTASAFPTRIGNHLANDRRLRTEGQSIRSSQFVFLLTSRAMADVACH